MADSIKLGSLDISAFKVGNASCKIYLGDTLLYPQNISYKLVAQYNDTTEYKVVCNGDTTLSTTDTRGHTTPISAMTSAVVNGGGCVTQIGLNAFSGATSLTSLTLSDGITTFNNQAFIEMHSLESFTFPSTLTTFGGSVFRFSNIKKFNNKIPSGVTYLQSGALADMYKLTGMTIPATITGSSTNLFLRDSGLTEVHFEGTTPPALGANAFKDCTALIKIYIPSCDCYDAYVADSQFSGLTNLIYGEDNTKCKEDAYPFAFKRTSRGGTAFTINCGSSSAQTIASANTKSGMTVAQITSSTATQTAVKMEFGDCCETIDSGAASGHTYLTAITISSHVKTIRNNAFANNYRIRNVTFGRGGSITTYDVVFNKFGISASTAPNVDMSNVNRLTVSQSRSATFTDCKINKLILPNKSTIGTSLCQNCTIGLLTIGSGASLSTYTLWNESLQRNQIYAPFSRDRVGNKINNITINNGVSSLPESCFNKLSGATSIVIPNSVTTIGTVCFAASSIQDVTIGTGCTSIGSQAFDMGTSHSLTVTIHATTPPALVNSITSTFASSNTVIYVPDASVDVYKAADRWSDSPSWIKPISQKP